MRPPDPFFNARQQAEHASAPLFLGRHLATFQPCPTSIAATGLVHAMKRRVRPAGWVARGA